MNATGVKDTLFLSLGGRSDLEADAPLDPEDESAPDRWRRPWGPPTQIAVASRRS